MRFHIQDPVKMDQKNQNVIVSIMMLFIPDLSLLTRKLQDLITVNKIKGSVGELMSWNRYKLVVITKQ